MYNAAFANLRNIESLILSGNSFYNIPADAFDGAEALEYLGMSNCGLTSLNPGWFEGKPNLEVLYLGSNRLTDIPDGTLNALTGLREFYVYNNQLLELRAAQFGNALSGVQIIYAIGNRINSVDAAIVNGASALDFFFLQNNLCVNLNFYDVRANLQDVLQRMQICSQNAVAAPAALCNYQQIGPDYVCQMLVTNPLGREFDSIAGDHIEGRADSDVFVANIVNQNTLNLPRVVCDQLNGIRR